MDPTRARDPALQEVLDARAIERTLIDYFDRIDADDPAGAAALWTQDAHADLLTGRVYEGRDAIGRALARILFQYERTSHHISNHRSWIDGDEARCETYVYAFHRMKGIRDIWHLWCRNLDTFRREDGLWLISSRVLVGVDATPEWELCPDDLFAGHPARRVREVPGEV